MKPSDYLDHIFEPWEYVAVKKCKNDPGFIYRPGEAALAEQLNDYVKNNRGVVWYYANPVTGERRDGSGASYADEFLSSCHHLVLECDHLNCDELWRRVLVQLRLPIRAIYTSGNVSTHALVRIGAATKDEFDAIRRGPIVAELCRLGADFNAITATRATRLPGVVRGDNGRMQRLLYLNPDADGTPIWQP